jgi:hypothetical protein
VVGFERGIGATGAIEKRGEALDMNRAGRVLSQVDETDQESRWDDKIPVGLLFFGLLMLVIHGLATAGATGGLMVLLGTGVLLVIYLPLTILGLFVASLVLDISFGEFWAAVLKIAGIYVFAAAIQDVGGTVVHPLLGVALAGLAMLYLYGKAFRLSFGEAIATVLVVAVVRVTLQFAIGALVARLR